MANKFQQNVCVLKLKSKLREKLKCPLKLSIQILPDLFNNTQDAYLSTTSKDFNCEAQLYVEEQYCTKRSSTSQNCMASI